MYKYNDKYRFQLGRGPVDGRKITCPYCGMPRRFVRYIDTQGEYVFPENVGRCDREVECGAHYTPRQFFYDNPDEKEKVCGGRSMGANSPWSGSQSSPQPQSQPKVKTNDTWQPSFIDEAVVQRSLSNYDTNPLFQFLASVFGNRKTEELTQLYRMGTDKLWGGATVFWQTDINGKVRSGKIMAYDQNTGHRIKTDGAKVCWVHVAMRLADFHLQQCLFGEHLLAQFPNSQVMIVESEKTAIICRHYMPDYVWISTGGKHGCFNSEAMQVLRGRDVILFPDLKAYDDWNNKLPMLREICKSASINDYLERVATDEQREQGLDIADFLLMNDTTQMLIRRFIEATPAVQLLIDDLKLEPDEEWNRNHGAGG